MRHVFLYEFVTGGGWFHVRSQGPPPDSLLREGRAMVMALAGDLAAMPETRVTLLRDERRSDWIVEDCEVRAVRSAHQEEEAVRELSRAADGTIVIAPEFSGFLAERSQWVEDSGGRLLSPSPALVELCADKRRTAEHLAAARLPVPEGVTFIVEPGASKEVTPPAIPFPFPAVLKLNDGAGSDGTRRLDSPSDWKDAWNNLHDFRERGAAVSHWRVERFCPGLAASVAVLCGPQGYVSLPPCSQIQTTDGAFQYLGGECPLPEQLASRAARLAQKAVATLPSPVGYVGVDLVLGDDPDGSQDAIIEINPRLTTSYVGLRRMVAGNLAAAMLDVASGEPVAVRFRRQRIKFHADGRVECG